MAAEVQKHRLDFPHLLDDDYAYWKALRNEYWPALYLLDRCGRIRGQSAGEVHAGEASALRIEAQIEALLGEPPTDCGR